MTTIVKAQRAWIAAAVLFAFHLVAPIASACSVCFGDKDDPMVQGTANGILLMIAVTYGMLLGMGALAATWFVRSRRMRVGSADAISLENK